MQQFKTLLRILLLFFIFESTVVIHEYGHFQEFRRHGISVEEFSIGSGPLLYQYKTDSSLNLSFRMIPIISYVKIKGNQQIWLRDKIIADIAGIRNNLGMGLVVVFLLQFLGWRKGNLSTKELIKTLMVTPLKIMLRFVAFLISCLTLGRINWADKFLLSTGKITPSEPLKWFITLNLILGLFNLVPIPPLDGGLVLKDIILLTFHTNIPEIPTFVIAVIFATYYTIADNQNMRMLEVDLQQKT